MASKLGTPDKVKYLRNILGLPRSCTPSSSVKSSILSRQSKSADRNIRAPASPITPRLYRGDRFIASRAGTNFDHSHHRLLTVPNQDRRVSPLQKENTSPYSPSRQETLEAFERYHQTKRVLTFSSPRPEDKINIDTNKEKSPIGIRKKKLPVREEKILDAPNIVNNFFLRAIDWSCQNPMAAALGPDVYFWWADNNTTEQLVIEPVKEITQVRWNHEGNRLAVAADDGFLQIWNANKKLEYSFEFGEYLSSLVWNGNVIICGGTSGRIHYHDISNLDITSSVLAHSDIICGLSMSPKFNMLLSGDCSGCVKIWLTSERKKSFQTLRHHKSAVKAMAWCPWKNNIFATAGGALDHTLCVWQVGQIKPMASVDTIAQVCDLLWAPAYNEILTCHSEPRCTVAVWSYPSLDLIGELAGHESRILTVNLSPNGLELASISADETIRIWKCFSKEEPKQSVRSILDMTIR